MIDMTIKEKADIRLSIYELKLFLIFIKVCRLGISASARIELFLQITEARIWTYVNTATHVNPNLGAVITTNYRTVVYQGNLQSETGCCCCCADSGRTGTTYD